MADRNERVMEMVRRELDRDPEVGLDVLMKKAREIDPGVEGLSTRQFHARYPLQIKRSRGREQTQKDKRGKKRAPRAPRAARATRGPTAAGGSDRDAIRSVFLQFASDFAEAESRQQIVRVLSSIDEYVDRVQSVVAKK